MGINPSPAATAAVLPEDLEQQLRTLFTEELQGRRRSVIAARRKAAGFPTGKRFDSWDPALSTIPIATQQALQTMEWVHRKENLVLAGPSGTGKTFFLEALGQQAISEGLKVAWFTLEQLAGIVRSHRVDDSVGKAVEKVLRVDLIIIDDIGLLPVPLDAAEALYRVVDTGYEKGSLAVSSNLHPSVFDELMPKTLATATVDRLLHHAHICQTSGESVRLARALAGTGVSALR